MFALSSHQKRGVFPEMEKSCCFGLIASCRWQVCKEGAELVKITTRRKREHKVQFVTALLAFAVIKTMPKFPLMTSSDVGNLGHQIQGFKETFQQLWNLVQGYWPQVCSDGFHICTNMVSAVAEELAYFSELSDNLESFAPCLLYCSFI